MKLKFDKLQAEAKAENCVLERERHVIDGETYRYSLYDNTRCVEYELKNLIEVWDEIKYIRVDNILKEADKIVKQRIIEGWTKQDFANELKKLLTEST